MYITYEEANILMGQIVTYLEEQGIELLKSDGTAPGEEFYAGLTELLFSKNAKVWDSHNQVWTMFHDKDLLRIAEEIRHEEKWLHRMPTYFGHHTEATEATEEEWKAAFSKWQYTDPPETAIFENEEEEEERDNEDL